MMESYLLKSSAVLITFYILYRIIMYFEPNNQVKRFVGLACIVFSAGFLLIPSTSLISAGSYPVIIQDAVQNASLIQKSISQTLPEDSISAFMIIYSIGLGLFAIRFIVGILSLIRLYLTSEKFNRWGFKVVVSRKNISPFTFFGLLFIQKDDLEKEDIDAMIVHEQVHRDQFHSADSIVLQFFSILYWFNPVMWLFQKDIRAQHEFLADEKVLKKGFDRLSYQHMLFKARTGVALQSVSYLSSKTSLKQRFKMMEKAKITTNSSYMRAAIFLPLMAIAISVTSFAPVELEGMMFSSTPTFTILGDDGEVDLKKGISRSTKRLFITATSSKKKDEEMRFIVSKAVTTLVAGGLGLGQIESRGIISLEDLTSSLDKDRKAILVVEILEYQSKNADNIVEGFKLEDPVFLSIPIK